MRNRVALITGGARGIGRGIAEAFVKAGARVVVADLTAGAESEWSYDLSDSTDLEQTVREQSAFGDISATAVDVTDAVSCAAAVAATVSTYGGLDILVNNAGVVQSGPIDDFAESAWDNIFAVNTKGIFLMTKAALPELRKSTSAVIINIASIAGKKGHRNMAAYCGSKFAAIGITQSLAAELAGSGIRVNALCPGIVGTAMWLEHLLPTHALEPAQQDAEFEAAISRTIPLGRPQTAADMGAAALYLATAPNVTGVSLNVAGGIEMN